MILYLLFTGVMVAAFALALLMTLYDDPKSQDDRLIYMAGLAAICRSSPLPSSSRRLLASRRVRATVFPVRNVPQSVLDRPEPLAYLCIL